LGKGGDSMINVIEGCMDRWIEVDTLPIVYVLADKARDKPVP
jgi:hypothetical protein